MEASNTPDQQHQPFIQRLGRFLGYLEKIALAIIVIGLALRYSKIVSSDLLNVGFLALAGAYFLSAFQRPASGDGEENIDRKSGFSDLLILTIFPKIFWIGCSIAVIGVDFYLLSLVGYKPMMQMSFVAITICLVLYVISSLRSAANLGAITPILLRAVPLALLEAYILYGGAV